MSRGGEHFVSSKKHTLDIFGWILFNQVCAMSHLEMWGFEYVRKPGVNSFWLTSSCLNSWTSLAVTCSKILLMLFLASPDRGLVRLSSSDSENGPLLLGILAYDQAHTVGHESMGDLLSSMNLQHVCQGSEAISQGVAMLAQLRTVVVRWFPDPGILIVECLDWRWCLLEGFLECQEYYATDLAF